MRDHKEFKARRDCRGSRVMPDRKVHRGHKVIKGHRGFRDRPVPMELMARPYSMERQILMLGRVSMETSISTQHQTRSSVPRLPVPGQHPAHRLLGRRETKEIKETPVIKDRKGQVELRVRKVMRGHKELKVSRVYRVLRVI